MLASVTRETWKSSTPADAPGFDTELTGSPVVALMMSTSSPMPPNTAVPAVMVSVGCPSVVEFTTLTAEMVQQQAQQPARSSESPPAQFSAYVAFVQRALLIWPCRAWLMGVLLLRGAADEGVGGVASIIRARAVARSPLAA